MRGSAARILIVDDDELGTMARAAVLRTVGYHITATLERNEAISLTAEETFDLMILDFDLPNMNGIQLALYLRKEGALPPCS